MPSALLNPVQPILFRALRSVGLGALVAFSSALLWAQSEAPIYSFTHFAGALGGPGKADGTGSAARFNSPNAVAVDQSGNTYVSDRDNHTIRKITPAGVVTTLAGEAGVSGANDGMGASAHFNRPAALAVDAAGNIFVADLNNGTIRKITPAGFVSTVAGRSGMGGALDGPVAVALFSRPAGVAVDRTGNVFVSDGGNGTIRKISAGGEVTTLAGSPNAYQYAYWGSADGIFDGVGAGALFFNPGQMAVDSAGNLYVQDMAAVSNPSWYGDFRQCGIVRKVTPAGGVTTVAVTFTPSSSAISAVRLSSLVGIAVDAADNLVIATEQDVRKITPAGVVTTNFSGVSGITGSSLATDVAGNFAVADTGHHTILKFTAAGAVTTLAGSAPTSGSTDGTGSDARFSNPSGVAVDDAGNVYVADSTNNTVRKISPGGVVTTLVGMPGSSGLDVDGTGPEARLHLPSSVAVDHAGNVYVMDFYGLHKITAGGVMTTFPNVYSTGTGLATDRAGNVYFPSGTAIHKVTPAGVDSILAGVNVAGADGFGNLDGTGSDARFSLPSGIAADSADNLYVADTYNHVIRKITPAGVVTTLSPVIPSPKGVAVDKKTGALFVLAEGVIYRMIPGGTATVVAGKKYILGSEDGIGAAAEFNNPRSLAVDNEGALYVADSGNNAIRKGTTAIAAQTALQNVLSGNGATFSVTAPGTTSYQWQRSTDGGLTWTVLTNGAIFSGVTTATLTVGNVDAGMSGWRFRANLTGSYGNMVGAPAILNVISYGTTAGFLWGRTGPGLLPVYTPKAIAGGVASVAASYMHTYFVKTDGTLWTMGDNTDNNLGDGSIPALPQSTPVQVASGVSSVASGYSHTMFIKTDGTLWGMGWNANGQLGDGTTIDRKTPVQIATGVASVAASNAYTLFIKTDGTLWAMGQNQGGQLGDGTTTDRAAPVQIATGVKSASAGGYHALFVKTDGTLWSMGQNGYGQLGIGTINGSEFQTTPVQVATGVASVAAGDLHTLFIKTDGTLWAMGANASGQLGDGSFTDRGSPVLVASGVAKVAAGGTQTLFLKTDGTLWRTNRAPQTVPIQVAAGIVSISAGAAHSMAINTEGILLATGDNQYGQLGDRQAAPGAPLIASDVVAAGADMPENTLFIKSDGTLWEHRSGEVAQISGVSGVVQAIAGTFGQRRLYLKGDGTLWLLALDGTSSQVASGVVSAGAGLNYFVWLKTDGTLWGQGGDDLIRLGDGTAPFQVADQVMSVSAAGWHFLYVKNDRTLWGMGQPWGAFDDINSWDHFKSTPVQLEQGVTMAVANSHQNLYLKTDGTLWTRGPGWSSYTGPAVQADSDVLSAASGYNGNAALSLYLKADGIMRSRLGANGTLGAVTEEARGIFSIAGGSEWYLYLQSAGTGTAPTITAEPQSLAVVSGTAATFQVGVSGSGPLNFQWFKNGAAILWAQAEKFTVPYATMADAGSYSVTITNSAGAVTSSTVSLTVGVAPTITAQPESRAVTLGGSVSFTVAAGCIPAPTYQWMKDGAAISGANSSSYTIASVAAGDVGCYTAVVSNALGSMASNAATLSSGVPPAGFDVAAYLSRYPEVAALYGDNPYGAWLYYRDHGIYQGEIFDETFRVEEYLALYPELFSVFGNDLGGALVHWLTEGRIEGRLGRIPLEFSAAGYFARNPDVAAAVHNDPILAWGHYWAYGIYEGRAYDDELRVFEYLALNADLQTAFLSDWRGGTLHWMRYGRTEGRLGRIPLSFDATEYINKYPEVGASWGTYATTVWQHYWLYGIDEGRTFDDKFRVDDYLTLNPDLAAVFGTNRRGAFMHWVRYGQTEGRPGRIP